MKKAELDVTAAIGPMVTDTTLPEMENEVGVAVIAVHTPDAHFRYAVKTPTTGVKGPGTGLEYLT
jgi:hypothetical protein